MPYIKQIFREKLEAGTLLIGPGLVAGELNYLITELIKKYLGSNPNYQRYNDVIGALESAKLELYRRKISPYEDTKIDENGDIY